MFTLFGAQGSGSAAIEIALGRCAVPYRVVRAATWEADSALDELLRVNPLQQVPTLLLPDGSVLSESAAILIHLGLAYPAAVLLPADVPARAQAIRGLVYIAANCYPAIGIIDYPERWLGPAGDADDATKERLRRGSRERLHLHWSHFADQFPVSAAQSFLCGSGAPGALDMLAAVVSKWSGARAFLREQRPAFHALLERIEAHPSVAPVFSRHWPTSTNTQAIQGDPTMPAYLIADVTLHDSAAYEEYQQKVPAMIAAHGGRYLVRGGAARVLEGSWLPQRAVVLEFPTRAALEAFWASPEYQPMRALRERVARSNIIVVDGV